MNGTFFWNGGSNKERFCLIPKAQKNTDDLTVFLRFWYLCMLKLDVNMVLKSTTGSRDLGILKVAAQNFCSSQSVINTGQPQLPYAQAAKKNELQKIKLPPTGKKSHLSFFLHVEKTVSGKKH